MHNSHFEPNCTVHTATWIFFSGSLGYVCMCFYTWGICNTSNFVKNTKTWFWIILNNGDHTCLIIKKLLWLRFAGFNPLKQCLDRSTSLLVYRCFLEIFEFYLLAPFWFYSVINMSNVILRSTWQQLNVQY